MSVLAMLREANVEQFEEKLLQDTCALQSQRGFLFSAEEIKYVTDLAVSDKHTQQEIVQMFSRKYNKVIDQSTISKYKGYYCKSKSYFSPATRGPKHLLDDAARGEDSFHVQKTSNTWVRSHSTALPIHCSRCDAEDVR